MIENSLKQNPQEGISVDRSPSQVHIGQLEGIIEKSSTENWEIGFFEKTEEIIALIDREQSRKAAEQMLGVYKKDHGYGRLTKAHAQAFIGALEIFLE